MHGAKSWSIVGCGDADFGTFVISSHLSLNKFIRACRSCNAFQSRIEVDCLAQWFGSRPGWQFDAIVPDHPHADFRCAGDVGTASRYEQRVIGTYIESREGYAVGLGARLIKSRFLCGHNCVERYTAARGRASPKRGGAVGHNAKAEPSRAQAGEHARDLRPGGQIVPICVQRCGSGGGQAGIGRCLGDEFLVRPISTTSIGQF